MFAKSDIQYYHTDVIIECFRLGVRRMQKQPFPANCCLFLRFLQMASHMW